MQGYLNGNSAGSAGKRDTLPKKPSSNLLNSSSNQMLYKDALLNSSSNNNRDLSPTHFREQQQYQQQFQYKDHQQQSPYRSSNNNNSNGIQKTPSALTDRPRTSQYTSSKEHNNSSPIRGSNYPSNLQANIQSQSSRITSLADKRENGNNSSNPLDIIQKQGLIQDSFDRTGKRTQLEEIHSNISNNNNTSNPQIQGNKLVLQQQQLLQQQQQQQQQSVRSATNKMQQLLKDMMGNDKRTSYNNGNSNNNTSASAKAISNHLNKTDNHLQQHLQQQQQQLTRGDSIGVRSRDTSAERERPTQSAKTSRSTQQNITNSGTLSQQQQLQQYQLQQQQILQSRGSISPINARSSIPSTTLHVSQQQQQQLNKQSSQGQLILPSKYAGNSNNISTNNLMSGYGNNNSNNNINNNNRNNSSKLRLQGDVIEAVYKNSNRPITPKDNRSRTPNHAMNQQGNQYINESSSHNQSEAGLSYKETFENANQTYCAGSSGNNNKAESYLEQLLLGGRTSSQHTSSQNQIYNNNNNSSKNEYSVYSKIQQQQQQNKQLSNDVNNKDVQDRRQQQQLSPLRHQMASNNNNNNVLEAGQFFERHASLQNIHHPHNGHTSSSNTSLQSALKATQNYNNIPSSNSNNNAKVQFKSNEVADSTNSNNTSYNLGKVANSNTSKIPQNIQNNSNNNDTENNMNSKQSLKQYQQIQQQPQQISGTIYSSPSATSKLSSALLAQQEKMNKLQSQQDKQNFVSSPKSTIDQQSPLYQKPIGSSQKREVLLLSEREKESKTFLAIQEQLRLKHEIQLRQQEQEQQDNLADMSGSNGYGNDINRNGKKRTKKLSESLLESNYFQFTPSAVQQYQEECKAINGNASADKGQQEIANNVCYAEQQQQANRQIGGTKGRQLQQQIEVEQVQKYNQQATSTTGGQGLSNNNSSTNNDQQLRQLPKNNNNNNSIPQGSGNTPTAAKDKLENKSIVKDQINISHTTNASSISTNTTSTFSEELSRSSLAKIDLKILMRVEQSLYDLSRTEIHKRKTVTGICKDYLEAIADESLDSLEKLGSDNKQSQILTRVFILERMCVVLALHESLRNTQDEQNTTNNNNINNNTNCQDSSQGQDDFLEEDRVHELVNCMQYVHLNSVLCMECVMRSQQVSSEGCVSVRRVLDQRSKKSKRIASVLAKTDKFQLMNNYSNIILPYLNNLATSQDSPTLMAIRNIIGNIPNVTLAQSTQILMDSFSKMIVDLEEKASKDSIHSNNSKSLAHDSISDASSSSSNNSQIDISFEQRKHKDTARSPFIETNNGNNNNNTNNKNSKSNNNNITNKINDKKINNSNNTNTNQAVNDSSNSNAMKKKKNNVEEYKKSETSHKRRDDNQGIKQGQQQQQDNEDEECMDDEEYNVDGEEEDEDEEDDGYDQVVRGSVKAPYLPQMKDSNKHTLVLDLDETLVHYQEIPNEGGQFLIRPNAEVFLQVMAQHYEIVIFTAAIKEYADFILDVIDNKSISHRLYRQHTSTDGRNYIKDLSKLGRDLSKILIIDNLPENFCRQPKNGVLIQSWYGEADDRALFDLIPLLTQITKNKKYRDVRDALQRYREQMMKNLLNGVQDPHIHLDLDDAENEKEGEDEEQEEEEEEEEEEDTH